MSILRGAGRALGRSRPLKYGTIATAGILGAGSALKDRSGPYGDVQEQAFGHRDAVRASIAAEISATASRLGGNNDTLGQSSVYYGRNVNPRSTNFPADGQIVFGMWNNRR